MRKSLYNQAITFVSFGLLAIIFGFIATAAFIFFKALFGSEVGIRKDLTAAFMGAFFAFLFVRIQQFPISRHALFLGGMRESVFVNFLEQSHDGTNGWSRSTASHRYFAC